MANVNAPRGFIPVGHLHGGVVRSQEHQILYSYATALFCGDAVVLASGYVNKAADSSAAILGVFSGCEYKDNNGNWVYSKTWPGVALTDTAAVVKAHVWVDPGIIFEVQTDTGTTSSIANVGGSYDIELDNAGSTVTGQSGMELDISDTSNVQWTIVGLAAAPDNAWGTNAKVLVVNNVPALG